MHDPGPFGSWHSCMIRKYLVFVHPWSLDEYSTNELEHSDWMPPDDETREGSLQLIKSQRIRKAQLIP
ncbi:hypothetical protein CDAR_33201 [Caerostris darwini]|uniref:Uncharacterized protein n=1 Tax=Caerostris darwini TaxID=1538125 RepID=A0AAV4X5A0_9ARAC|nr:hypothetical protein CDAR_33201 [Caerostris darwini]